MKKLKCKRINKKYVIPTKSWLVPLKKMNFDDVYTNGNFMLSKLLEKEKILVKVTSDENDHVDLKEINKNLKGLANMVYIYCTFSCYDNFNHITDNEEFCVKTKYSKPVVLELMRYYKKRSLSKFKNKIDDKQILCNILKQLLLAQFNIFGLYSYTHNDVHLGNILIHKHRENINLKYKFTNKQIISRYEYILSDYDRIFENTNEKTQNDLMDNCLLANVLRTVNTVIELFLNQNILQKQILDVQEIYEEKIYSTTKKQIKKYLKKELTKEKYIKSQIDINLEFTDKILLLFE